jgi:SAM-dependent methyltransferase
MAEANKYVGNELEVFAGAVNWKGYLRRRIARYYGRSVLEVGAGIGGTTRVLHDGSVERWVCLEPDPELASRLAESASRGELPAPCETAVGAIESMPPGETFDAILYIDVLEHIEDDRAELARAAERLRLGGRVVVLSPAHQFLFTPFDAAIGHFRRYSKSTLRAAGPPALRLERLDYLDSAGMLLSLGNRLVLKSASPSRAQVAVWDGVVVPVSRVLDPLLRHAVGKSVLGVWRKP